MRLALLILAAALLTSSIHAEDALVVHPGVPLDAVDQTTLRDVFLGRRTTWSNGERVVVVLLRDGEANARLAARLGKTPQQLINWWKRMVFTGEGNMPEQADNRAALLARVALIPGAIGWIEQDGPGDTGVRTLPPP